MAAYPTGRKVCTMCGWRHIMDFTIHRTRSHGSWYVYLQSRCRTCRRIDHRVKNPGAKALVAGEREHTALTRSRISASVRKAKAQNNRTLPVDKRCNNPECASPVHPGPQPSKNFSIKKRTLVDGSLSFELASRCRDCERRRLRAYSASLSKEERQRRNRQGGERRAQREKEARERSKSSAGKRGSAHLDSTVLLAWWEGSDFGIPMDANLQRRMSEARRSGLVSYRVVDALCVSVGRPEMVDLLYPDAV